MRWPIQAQLLLPMLTIVVLAVVLVSATSAWFVAAGARRHQAESIRRMADTLANATFPLTDDVLQKMSALSGADFVLLDPRGHVRGHTLLLRAEEAAVLASLPVERDEADLLGKCAVTVSSRLYHAERLPVGRQRVDADVDSIIVLYPENRWWAVVRQTVYPVLGVGIAAALVVVLVTTVLARRFVRPILQLGKQTEMIAGGEFHPVTVPARNDEIHDLAVSINRMTAKLSEYEDGVRHRERLRTLGQLGAGMAHQLRNSAAGALMAIELHQRECRMGSDCESLGVAIRQLRLMEAYLQRFLRPAVGDLREEVALAPLVDEVLDLVRPACNHARIALTFRHPHGSLSVHGERESLRQLLVNLVVNAIEATRRRGHRDGRVIVQLEQPHTDRVVLQVKDSGPGPAPSMRDRLFEPFVTEKPDGTGLGLAVARQIAEDHGGTIQWQRQHEMTCFTVEFPLAACGSGVA